MLLREDEPVWTCLFPYILIGFSASPRPGRAGARQQYRTYCAQRRAGSQARDFDLLIRPADSGAYGWNQGVYLDKLSSIIMGPRRERMDKSATRTGARHALSLRAALPGRGR